MRDGGVIECGMRGVGDEIGGEVVKGRMVVWKEYKKGGGEEVVKELEKEVKKVRGG